MNAVSLQVARSRTRLARLGFPLRPAPIPQGVTPPVDRRSLGADYDTEWARRYPARVARAAIVEGVMRPVMTVIADPTVVGLDRLDEVKGPVVFAANHHSHADTPLLMTSIPEPWRHQLVVAAAADYFFASRFGGVLSALAIGAVPVDRTKVSRSSGDRIAELIADGWSLLIYPEGGRSPDGWGQEFRGGAAYLAIRCGIPVVPIHVAGTGQILRKGRTLPRRSKTTVAFGTPMTAGSGESARAFNSRLEAAVTGLADETATDWWVARRRAFAGTSPGLTGPEVNAWRRAWALGDQNGRTRRRRRRWPDL